MGPVTITERFTTQCSPVISSNYDTCGTVTRSTVAHLNVTQLLALFTSGGLFADLDAWFKHSIEMRACGVQRYALYDWIMANADRRLMRSAVSDTKVAGSSSLVHPFIFGRQNSVVNKDHYRLQQSFAVNAYNGPVSTLVAGAITAGAALDPQATMRIIRLENRFGAPMDPNFFRGAGDSALNGDVIHVFGSTAGRSTHTAWKVYASGSDGNLTFVDVLAFPINTGSDERTDVTPQAGVVIIGINNVNDYERWCQNLPTLDPRKRVPFWVQTSRYTRCVDSMYKEVYAKLLETNPAFAEFGDLPMAQRNAQDEMERQKRFVNDFFYNKPISSNQNLVQWENLQAINTASGAVINPGLGGKLITRRANFVGVREQLRVCGRVLDLEKNPLNFYEFLQANYDIARARKTATGRSVTDIDWWTNSPFRAQFASAAVAYYTQEYGTSARFTYELDKLNDLGMAWDWYKFKFPAGIRINILSDEYFDDFLDANQASSQEERGNLLLCLDIGKPQAGSIYWAQIASNRKVFSTAKINELAKYDATYRCVMETVEIEQTLYSETGTVVVECPLSNLWIENFASSVPITTGKTMNPSPYGYGNLYVPFIVALTSIATGLCSMASNLFC